MSTVEEGSLESFPDEALISIFYNLDEEELRAICLTNTNLSRFCGDKKLRLNALRHSYSLRADLGKLFAALLLHGREERDIERLSVILELHPEWSNGVIAFSYLEEPGEWYYIRPLEATNNVKILSLLLVQGADPHISSLYLGRGYHLPSENRGSITVEDFSLANPPIEGNLLSILALSLRFEDPSLHFLLLQRGYRLQWDEFGFYLGHLNLDLLMHYVRHYPPADLSFLYHDGVGRDYFFPLLQLLSSSPDKLGLTIELDADLFPEPIATILSVYRPLYNELVVDLRAHAHGTSPPFATLRQLQLNFPDIPSRALFGDLNVEQYMAEISLLTLTLQHANGDEYSYRFNYYQACGLSGAFSALQQSLPEKGMIMETEVEVKKGVATKQSYRFDPSVRLLPYLLRYVDGQGEEHTVQYEDRDYEAGFRLGLSLFSLEEGFKVLV